MKSKIASVILAAGKGSRMRSFLPKALHPVGGVPMLERIVKQASDIPSEICYVVCRSVDGLTRSIVSELNMRFGVPVIEKFQDEALGTAHAVRCGIENIDAEITHILVLYGDVPNLRVSTLRRLTEGCNDGEISVLVAEVGNPTGYGRIIRNDRGCVSAIAEERDCDEAQRAIREINTGIYFMRLDIAQKYLDRVDRNNAANEYYLTDIIHMAASDGIEIRTIKLDDPREAQGVNSPEQLEEAEAWARENAT